MKSLLKNKIVIIIIAMLAGALIMYWIAPSGSKDNITDSEMHSEADHASEEIWTCSMHPQIRQNEPGDCPICGMDLIPVANDAMDGDPLAIKMSKNAMQLANVRTASVGKEAAIKKIRLNGKVMADERRMYSQVSHIAGRIEDLSVNFTGEYVSKGQRIAKIYSPELVSAQKELFETIKLKDTQPQFYEAAREKLKNWRLSEAQINKIVESGIIQESFPIQADVSGYIEKKMVNLGDYVPRGAMLYQIADLSKVWVMFDVYENDLPWVQKGDKIEYTISAIPGKTFEGTVDYIDPVVDSKSRVSKARVEVSNRDLELKPEMFASATIQAKLAKQKGIVVPKSAVLWTGKRSVVYVKNAGDEQVSFKLREVILGPALGDAYLIESGLEIGEEIAVNGTFSIDAAAQLAGKASMMNPDMMDEGMTMEKDNMGMDASKMKTMEMKNSKMDMEHSKKAMEKVMPDGKSKTTLQALVKSYYALAKALDTDDFDKAKTEAKAIRKHILDANKLLIGQEEQAYWKLYDTALLNSSKAINNSEDITGIRSHFDELSLAMAKLVKDFKLGKEKIYVNICPMANDNKGAVWLSPTEKIANPYFGSAMHKCGSTQEIIN